MQNPWTKFSWNNWVQVMTKVCWLHLSDWHQEGKNFDRKVVRDALLDDIKNRKGIDPLLEQVNFVVFSGDLAGKGNDADEYETAQLELLDPILEAVGLGQDRLFMVPGNHDLNRNHIEEMLPPLLQHPLTSRESVQQWLTNDAKRERALEPFAIYRNFVSGYTKQPNPDYASIKYFDINGKQVALLGINSAWMCARHKETDEKGKERILDRGYLIIGEPQIHDALREIASADIRIAALHHPFDWLINFDQIVVRPRLMSGCHFILHGHGHQPKVDLGGTEGDCITIPAGACFDRRDFPNSYNWVHLDLLSGTGNVWLRRWGKDKWTEDIDTYPGEKFPLERLPKELGFPATRKTISATNPTHPLSNPQISANHSTPNPYANLNFSRPQTSPFAHDTDGTRSKLPPLHLGTVWGLQRGRFIGIVSGTTAEQIFDLLSSTEDMLGQAIQRMGENMEDPPNLGTRIWSRLAPEFDNPRPSCPEDFISVCVDLDPRLKEIFQIGKAESVFPGFVIGINSDTFIQYRHLIPAIVGPELSGFSASTIFVVEDSEPDLAASLAKRLSDIVQEQAQNIPLDKFRVGLSTPWEIQKESRECSRILEQIIGQLGTPASEGNREDVVPLLEEIIGNVNLNECPSVVLNALIHRYPFWNKAIIRVASQTENLSLRRASLHLANANDELLDEWASGYLARGKLELIPQDFIAPQRTTHSILDGLSLALIRLRINNPGKTTPVNDILDALFSRLNPHPAVLRLDKVLREKTTLAREDLREICGEDIVDVSVEILWYMLRTGALDPLADWILEDLKIDHPQAWWILYSYPWDQKGVQNLLTQPPRKRAIFGLCRPQEWQTICRQPTLEDAIMLCRKGRGLCFDN
uniref:Calcineurin-like phosphoesterase n=1 Tax=Candidatus Kentrum sp. DK TaxID=2126562 RepID=A0A450SF19_9GAMM|nr:MAG: Calcineurin-like phosphoesterase [Candidatus Kentron sp. DK]